MTIFTYPVFSQKISNYDTNGKTTKSTSEYVQVKIKNVVSENEVDPIGSIILGPVFNITNSLIKNGIAKRQKSFVATYSNSARTSNCAKLNELVSTRYAIDGLNQIDSNHIVAEYIFELTPDSSSNKLKINLKSVRLNKSKARFKKDDNLSIGIAIKTTYLKKTVGSTAQPPPIITDGMIIIPIIKAQNESQNFTNLKGVNPIFIDGIDFKKIDYIQFAVNFTETNTSHLDQNTLQNILSNNGGDIQTSLKTIFGIK